MMEYYTKAEMRELEETILDYQDDELCVLRGLIGIRQLIRQNRDYVAIAQAIDHLIRLHDLELVNKAEELGSNL